MKKRILSACFSLLLFSCSSDESEPNGRTYQMGFQNSAPCFDDLNLFLQSLNIWTTRADAAIITTEVPWKALLAGENTVDYVVNNYKGLVEFYRAKNLTLWIYVDPQNGLNRASDAVDLAAAGKSIVQLEMQEIYKRFVVVMDSVLTPEHVGLALETNLIRAAASAGIYNGVKDAANDVAAELKFRNSKAKLSVSVQVDHAWGKLAGGSYEGVEQDFRDFPFMEEVGLSSYPYFGFDKPTDIPVDYYSRLLIGHDLEAFVSEGGWASQSITTPTLSFVSSNQLQKEYIEHHHKLLDKVQATAYFQLVFTDIDANSLPSNVPDNIGYFIFLGMVDATLMPKPALDAWDNLFNKRFK